MIYRYPTIIIISERNEIVGNNWIDSLREWIVQKEKAILTGKILYIYIVGEGL